MTDGLSVAGAGLAPTGGSVGPSTMPLSKSEPARTTAVETAMAVAEMNTLLVPLVVTWTGRSWPIGFAVVMDGRNTHRLVRDALPRRAPR